MVECMSEWMNLMNCSKKKRLETMRKWFNNEFSEYCWIEIENNEKVVEWMKKWVTERMIFMDFTKKKLKPMRK